MIRRDHGDTSLALLACEDDKTHESEMELGEARFLAPLSRSSFSHQVLLDFRYAAILWETIWLVVW